MNVAIKNGPKFWISNEKAMFLKKHSKKSRVQKSWLEVWNLNCFGLWAQIALTPCSKYDWAGNKRRAIF